MNHSRSFGDHQRRRGSNSSRSSDDDSHPGRKGLEQPILIYHESARSIVFRDHLRRAMQENGQPQKEKYHIEKLADNIQGSRRDTVEAVAKDIGHVLGLDQLIEQETIHPIEAGISSTQIAGYTPTIKPLPRMVFGPDDIFEPLLDSVDPDLWSEAEQEVVAMLEHQQACVKTIKNVDWTAFLHRFSIAEPIKPRLLMQHNDIPPDESHPFNSFVTSTTLLPKLGKKMRCFGSVSQYTVGVVFGLPKFENNDYEDEAASSSHTWSWPAGYSAKTEFNIDGRGRLINGREEALRSLSELREYNQEYLTMQEYMVANRKVSGLSQIPYNEVYLRVGGVGRIVHDYDVATNQEVSLADGTARTFERGVGIPVALFIRTATFGHLIALLRTRARLYHVLGHEHVKDIPLLMITPNDGVRVLTETLQTTLLKVAANQLQPFQDPAIAHNTTITNTSDTAFQQKMEELLDFDDTIRHVLTPEELAHLAGGFGATDDSVASMLQDVAKLDKKLQLSGEDKSSHRLQDVVNEGLCSAVRSGDYHTARQLLILYSLVSSMNADGRVHDPSEEESSVEHEAEARRRQKALKKHESINFVNTKPLLSKHEHLALKHAQSDIILAATIPPPPPPPPLDTDRLRSATNSDGLLAVLGAAQILRSMRDGGAKMRAQEAVSALEEWVAYGEQSVAFRISSWYDQRAAQGDLKIASNDKSNFMAFVSNKAITNRKKFGQQLRKAVQSTDFSDMAFLEGIDAMVQLMHSPCLRLELLQYVLGLDNRYSVAHVARSIELAATCLSISAVR